MVEVVQTSWRLFHPWLLLDVVCGFPLPPTILVLGSGAARPTSLLQALLCGAYFTSSCLGLNSPHFEPLSQASLRALSLNSLFLLALATAKRVGELQALSSIVTFVGVDACLLYIPQFVAKSQSLTRSIPRSFLVKSLSDFAAGLDDDLLLCPVRALRFYKSLSPFR